MPCPKRRVLHAAAAHQCGLCRAREVALVQPDRPGAFAAAAREIQREHEHVAYLALFGHESVKVGVTARRRGDRRLMEQGAAAALLFAEGDGVTIRRLERAATGVRGVTDQVRTRRKVAGLLEDLSPAAARARLSAARDDVAGGLPDEMAPHVLAEPVFTFLRDRYPGTLPPAPLHWLRRLTAGDRLGGTVATVVGALVVLEPDAQAIDGHLLAGHGVRLLDEPVATSVHDPGEWIAPAPRQQRLFD
jgi:hypothetical protein